MSDKLKAAAKAALEMLNDYRDCLQAANILRVGLAEPEEKLLSVHRLDQWLKASLAEQKPMLEMSAEKRPWVGLTAEDINQFETWFDEEEERKGWVDPALIAKYFDAKIKEKNT